MCPVHRDMIVQYKRNVSFRGRHCGLDRNRLLPQMVNFVHMSGCCGGNKEKQDINIVNKLLSALLPLKNAILHLISLQAEINKMSEVLNKHFVRVFTENKPFLCAHVWLLNYLSEKPQCSHFCAPSVSVGGCVCVFARHACHCPPRLANESICHSHMRCHFYGLASIIFHPVFFSNSNVLVHGANKARQNKRTQCKIGRASCRERV